MITLYKSLILSKIDYCSVLWNPTNLSDLRQLEESKQPILTECNVQKRRIAKKGTIGNDSNILNFTQYKDDLKDIPWFLCGKFTMALCLIQEYNSRTTTQEQDSHVWYQSIVANYDGNPL